jgi:hypothetical protein
VNDLGNLPLLAAVFLFPPFVSVGLRGGDWTYKGHRFLTMSPSPFARIDFTMIALESLATLALTGTVYLIAGARRK